MNKYIKNLIYIYYIFILTALALVRLFTELVNILYNF